MGRSRFLRMGVPGGGGNAFLLDGLTASFAVSTRKLSRTYTGDCVLLRRSSDDAEQAFGFVGVNLDTAAISAWGGEDTLYVKTWYDQSGNERNASQTTDANQPTLVLNTLNARATVRFDGADTQSLATATTPALAQPNTVFDVFKVDDPKPIQCLYDSTTDANQALMLFPVNNRKYNVFAGSEFVAGTANRATSAYRALAALFNRTSSLIEADGINQGASADPGTGGFAGIVLGRRGGGTANAMTGNRAEFVVCNADVGSTVRSRILTNQQRYFGMYAGRIIFDGDSLTFGSGSSDGQTYPAQCIALLPSKTGINIGIGGQPSSSLLTNTNAYPYGGLILDDIYVLWIGTNDLLISVAPATIYANIVELVNQRQSANYSKVIVCNMIDCQGTGRPVDYDTQKAALNTLISEGATTNGYTVANLAGDARLQNALDTTYFDVDKTHLTNAGYGVVASVVAAQI